ncbi:glycoside hydrolase family 9 protein [Pelagicoccus sp. SDUM812003]|uniref:glycoside hydrolase family 9 protein n=1 Tax=Pelagicoccus sp. SDUM812003 TaxID=3041267 RepID=UPI00280C59FC|nr:glycoside hydrolase family 9 protein [Pelagicoccus sp. SDUM812003]MDQ8201386.1 glycoside hydrolase family 9 protein [Pelagicoccus sp. SDUM812003]
MLKVLSTAALGLAFSTLSLSEEGQKDTLSLNELEYLEMPGLNVMLAHDYYPEGHQGGVSIIQNGKRVATNGDLRLDRTPGQWSPIPKKIGEREIDPETDTISCRFAYPDEARNRTGFNPIEYPDLEFSYSISVSPEEGSSFIVQVDLDQQLPSEWDGKVSFMMELFPGFLFGKSYSMDDREWGIFPRQADGPGRYDDHGAYAIDALATGDRLTIAPEDDSQRMRIQRMQGGELELVDGRGLHDNGWYIVRATLEKGAVENALRWKITPNALPDWKSDPVIQVSQVGYHPKQPKYAIVELDKRDTERKPLELSRLDEDGSLETVKRSVSSDWGQFLRYDYLRLDFSDVTQEGLYVVSYGEQRSHAFRIAKDIFTRHVWQPTLEYFLPAQMCHMRINDRYRVWHGACHLDDARMAPLDHVHFDGYEQGPEARTHFKPGEHVPGLNRGGWHDAGDDDLRIESQAGTVLGLVHAYEAFGRDYDNTTIDQQTLTVEIHKPDGIPDMLQQIEHGAITVAAGYRELGTLYRGIINPTLPQYVMLGDTVNMTDNRPFDQTLAEDQVPDIGLGIGGAPDDRWVFTTRRSERHEMIGAAGLAAAARALRGHNDSLAEECLRFAEELYESIEFENEISRIPLAVELLITTGKPKYAQSIRQQAAGIAERFENLGWTVSRTLPLIEDNVFLSTLHEAAKRYAQTVREAEGKTPYGVPYEPGIWGAGWGIQRFGAQQYFLHQAYPELFSRDLMLNALSFVLGCHPGSNTASFVSGVGSNSIEVGYGLNRADWSFIPGGSASGTALIRPDYPELLTWPFLWQQTEYVLGGGTTDYIILAQAADYLLNQE